MADRAGLDGTMLHYLAVVSYGERTQTRTLENHANLPAYLTN